ncbi:hypothetical protein JR316_0008948 [Psilocybe cubensis]|uniref:Uncharacterized protein n=2 Tax=Psilocybe cubensis TaxID=181762 RepID=A0A8H7XWH0_PSICU|nr:hypothetical protein JR316_0008948 [Psilocybe cubensis]KAH9478493.1 hypothetical protein JR316_0008948 [Psilocybe cubensis]
MSLWSCELSSCPFVQFRSRKNNEKKATDADGLDDYISDDETTAAPIPRDSTTQQEDEQDEEDLYASATQQSERDPIQHTLPTEGPTPDPSAWQAAEDLLSDVAADIKGKGKARDMDPPPPVIPTIHSPQYSEAEDDVQIPGLSQNRSHRVFSLDPAFETQESLAGPSRLPSVSVTADQEDIYQDQASLWSSLGRAAPQEPESSSSSWWQDPHTMSGLLDFNEPPASTSDSSHRGVQDPIPILPSSNIASTSNHQWEQGPSPGQTSFPQQESVPHFLLDNDDLPMEVASELGDIPMIGPELEEDYPMCDDEGYTCEQIFGSGVEIPEGNFGEAVWIQAQRYLLQQQMIQQQEHQHQQQILYEELYRQQQIRLLERQQYEAQMATMWEASLEGRLERATRFWNSIPALPRPPTATPPTVASSAATLPPSEPTPSQPIEKGMSAAQREYKRMMDRENVDRDLRRRFPYSIAASMGPSKFAYLQRSLRVLSTSPMNTLMLSRRSFKPAPLPATLPKKSVPPQRPTNSHVYGTPAVRKLHEEMKRAENERLARLSANSLGKRRMRVSDDSDSDDAIERPSKRVRADDLSASSSTHNNGKVPSNKPSKKKSNSSPSKSTSKFKMSTSKASMKRFVRDARAPSPPCLPPTSSLSNTLFPNEPLEIISRDHVSDYSSSDRARAFENRVNEMKNGPLYSALRRPSPSSASSNRSKKKVTFALPNLEDGDEEDSDTDVAGDDTRNNRNTVEVKTRICAKFLSSIAIMFRFGRFA